MTWFRVDDGFYSHEKVIRIPRAHRAEAIGTWTLCGTWSADKERDGFIPTHMVDELGGTAAGVEALIAVGLWRRRRDGYQVVNWSEYQFTRAQLVENRKREAQRKAAQRARKSNDDAGVSANVPAGQTRDPHYPSRPVPSRDDDERDIKSHPHVSSANPRTSDLSPALRAVIDAVAEVLHRQLHPLAAHDVIEFIEARRGPRASELKNPARYYVSAIEGSPAEIQQFIDEKGLAS